MDAVGFGYAAVVVIGGVIGYVKAGSSASLIAGVTFGSLAGVGAYMTSNDPKNIWLLLATSGLLSVVMGSRFYNSGKFMPAGLVFSLSLFMAARLGLRLLQH